MLSVTIRRGNQVRQYSVLARHGAGWELKLEQDAAVTRHVHYDDWHRVERTLARVNQEVAELLTEGLEIQSTNR